MIRSVVALPGDAVTECGDGAEVIDSFRSCTPDVVLMDLQMPRMNGIRATRALKDVYPDATVIIVSQFNDPEFRDEVVPDSARLGETNGRLMPIAGGHPTFQGSPMMTEYLRSSSVERWNWAWPMPK